MEKILFKIKSLGLGGIERLAIDILNNLKFENKKIVLMLENRENFFKNQIPREIEIVYLKSEKLEKIIDKIKNKKKNIFYRKIYKLLLKYERMEMARNINRYIFSNKESKIFIDYSGTAEEYISKIKIEKKIYWDHLSIGKMKNSRKRKRLLKRLDNFSQIVTICEEMAQEIREILPELSFKIKMIYNFIDENKIEKKLNEDKKLQEELSEERYCVSVGRLAEPKDYETTIKAFRILKEKGIKEKLFIIGDGYLKEKLNDLIKEMNLENQIFLLGAKSNPYIYMKYANLLIHSSKKEGFPIVLLEGMYGGVPIISSNFKTGACELIEKEKNGEIFKTGDYKDLANKIEKLLNNKDLRNKYSEKSKDFVKKFYLKEAIKNYKNFIESL